MISSYSSFSDATDNSAFCNKKTATKFSADYCFCHECDKIVTPRDRLYAISESDQGWTGSLGVTTCEPRSAFEKAYYDYFGVLFSPDASIAATVAEAMPFGYVYDSNLEDVVDDPEDFSVDFYENLADY